MKGLARQGTVHGDDRRILRSRTGILATGPAQPHGRIGVVGGGGSRGRLFGAAGIQRGDTEGKNRGHREYRFHHAPIACSDVIVVRTLLSTLRATASTPRS